MDLNKIKQKYPPFLGPIRSNQKVHEGDIFGLLTVLYRTNNKPNCNKTRYVCLCKCGTVKVINGDDLTRRRTNSCGRGDCYNMAHTIKQSLPNKEKIKFLNKFPKGYYIYKYVQNNEIIYIGKSEKLDKRIYQHKTDKLAGFKGNIYYFLCKYLKLIWII